LGALVHSHSRSIKTHGSAFPKGKQIVDSELCKKRLLDFYVCDLYLHYREREVQFELCDKKKTLKSKDSKTFRVLRSYKKSMEDMMVFSQQSISSFSSKWHNL
jgi:hypothetical protein